MKHIRKAGCPHAYAQWCASVAGTPKSNWSELPSNEKGPLLVALIAEQGSLCAYTTRRIDKDSAHVEHIKPQSLCRVDQPGSDLEYENLLACYPRDGMPKRYRYGAEKKDKWWKDNGVNFVSPLDPACEKRFRFQADGTVTAVKEHRGAATTIKVLALDHPSLTDDRRRIIAEFLYGPTGDDPLSATKARQAKARITQKNESGAYHEFCIAILHALEEYLTELEKKARKKRFARRQKERRD